MSGGITAIDNRLKDLQYKEKAKEYLSENEIIYEGIDFKNCKVSDFMKKEKVDNKGNKVIEVTAVGVTFYHEKLDDIEIKGVGPRVTVVFDNNAEVIGVLSTWRNFVKDKEITLDSLDNCMGKIKDKEAIFESKNQIDPDTKKTIKDVNLVYYNDPLGYKPEYLIPFYEFVGNDTKGNDFKIYTRALKDEDIVIEDIINYPDLEKREEKNQEEKSEYESRKANESPTNINSQDPDDYK